jgi:hypothetical protein
MVRAILAGAKTQTRRVVKSFELARGEARGVRVAPNTFCYLDYKIPGLGWCPYGGSPVVPYPQDRVEAASPYGRPGDWLWVRETWRPVASIPRHLEHYGRRTESIQYAADRAIQTRPVAPGWRKPKAAKTGNVSPLFMPRWASRITLEVTGVRVERLQAISDADAKAEGVLPYRVFGVDQKVPGPGFEGARLAEQPHRLPFADLWRSLHGEDSWETNPWVWVVEFRRVRPRLTAASTLSPGQPPTQRQ